jgi:hypothetical protein
MNRVHPIVPYELSTISPTPFFPSNTLFLNPNSDLFIPNILCQIFSLLFPVGLCSLEDSLIDTMSCMFPNTPPPCTVNDSIRLV